MIKTVEWVDGKAVLIDQTRLPHECVYLTLGDHQEVTHAIRVMQVRGAPAIGVTAALGMALGALEKEASASRPEFDSWIQQVGDTLSRTRPTAVNLFWAIERLLAIPRSHPEWTTARCQQEMVSAASGMVEEDISACRSLGFHGAELVPPEAAILTHCNAGALACAGYGTALGVVRAAAEQGKNVRVLADETRPRLQGAQLTCWELQHDGIPVTLIPDNASGSLLRRGDVDLVVVGADRIAANGDTANKIGTYNLAVLAHENSVPFYVAAPLSTVDFSLPTGEEIPIEERDSREVTHIQDRSITAPGVPALNLAFDVTPARYISAIITERGVARAPYDQGLKALAAMDHSAADPDRGGAATAIRASEP